MEVGADDLLFDVGGGALLARDGQAPRRYTAESVRSRPEAGDLRNAAASTDDEAGGMRDLPANVPGRPAGGGRRDHRRRHVRLHEGHGAIERYLARSTDATPFQLATEALPSGHSVGHLRCFLLSADRCARRGSTEQFVAAFAVLARAAGLPTRVVVGFTGAGSATAGTPVDVTAHAATAWPEVRFAGVGWVAFDPLPDPDVTTVTMPADVAGGGGAPDSTTATTLAGRERHGGRYGPGRRRRGDPGARRHPDRPLRGGGRPRGPGGRRARPAAGVAPAGAAPGTRARPGGWPAPGRRRPTGWRPRASR